MMNDALPISIVVSEDLQAQLNKIAAISNKLSAQLNFHTMTANWYGDEANLIQIKFMLQSHTEFAQQRQIAARAKPLFLADDVLIYDQSLHAQDCYLAITESELNLLQQNPKVVTGFLAKKLTKILNIIAKQRGLEKI